MALAIKASWLLDGKGGAPLADAVVLVEGGRIVSVTGAGARPADQAPAPAMSYDGCTILPGLIDAHVHLLGDRLARPVDSEAQLSREALLETGRKNAWTTLQAGITTARDCGAKGDAGPALKRELASGQTAGPHVLVCGCAFTTPRGHGYASGGVVSSLAEIEALLDEQAADGIDFVKVIASGGGMTPGSNLLVPQFPREQLQAIVDGAHRRGLKVAAHVRGTTAVIESIATGVDTIEHCSFMNAPDGAFYADPKIVADLRASGAMVVPTVVAYSPAMLEGKRRTVRSIYEAGIPMSGGTDAGIPRVGHGDLWREIIALVECGVPAAEAIGMATLMSARALGVESETGSVEAGKRADLIVVQGNPLDDLVTLSRPIMVMKAGDVVVGMQRPYAAV